VKAPPLASASVKTSEQLDQESCFLSDTHTASCRTDTGHTGGCFGRCSAGRNVENGDTLTFVQIPEVREPGSEVVSVLFSQSSSKELTFHCPQQMIPVLINSACPRNLPSRVKLIQPWNYSSPVTTNPN